MSWFLIKIAICFWGFFSAYSWLWDHWSYCCCFVYFASNEKLLCLSIMFFSFLSVMFCVIFVRFVLKYFIIFLLFKLCPYSFILFSKLSLLFIYYCFLLPSCSSSLFLFLPYPYSSLSLSLSLSLIFLPLGLNSCGDVGHLTVLVEIFLWLGSSFSSCCISLESQQRECTLF